MELENELLSPISPLKALLYRRASQAIVQAYGPLYKEVVEVTLCKEERLGHYQCNSALKLAPLLGEPPRKIAEKIVSYFITQLAEGEEGDYPCISELSVAGPGFINIRFHPRFLSQRLMQAFLDPRLGVPLPQVRQKVVVEFSSPNIAKELHVGHLRSTIIGDSLARLFEFMGQDVLRLNHIGDWGTQFGMLIAHLEEREPEVLTGEKEPDLPDLMRWYQEAKKRFDQEEAFKKRARDRVVDLQGGEKKSLHAWQIICDISRKAFKEIYDLLDVYLIERGESFYNPYLPLVVKDLEDKGLIALSDGAKCIFLEGFTNREGEPLPLMVQKSDGGYNYDTTDMAALLYRIEKDQADRIIIVTDAGQSLHFQMVFACAKKAGYLDIHPVELNHVPFGLVLGATGKKFKTREGQVEKLTDLLHEAVDHAKEILLERLPTLDSSEIDRLARILGIDAVKYADLSCHRVKDYHFSYERMLRFEGNTAAFLLYSYVRILGIKRKTGRDIETLLGQSSLSLIHPSEIALGLHLLRFSEILESVMRDLLPHRLAEYLYELAEKFNAFFRDCRVEGSPEEKERLLLCEITARILEKGLEILGLRVMDRM